MYNTIAMKRFLFAAVLVCIIFIPTKAQCQFDKNRATKIIMDKVNQHERESIKRIDRGDDDDDDDNDEARRNRLKAMSNSEFLNLINDSEYRYMILNDKSRLMAALSERRNILDQYKDDDLRKLIMSDPSLKKKVIDNIWEQKEKILELAKDSNIERLILSDPSLKEYYDIKLKILDIQEHPEKIIVYVDDPKIRQIIEDNPKLARILAQEIKKLEEDDLQRKQREIENDRIEREREEKERQFEIQRLKDEGERAAEQEAQNAQERNNDINLSHTLGSMMPTKQQNLTQNTVTGLQVSQEEYDELYEDPTLLNAKINCAVYNTKDNMEKAWKTAKMQSKTVLKESQNKIKGKLISIPVGKANGVMDNFFNTAWPNADMGTKVRVARDIYQEESNLASDVLKCIVHEGVEAVSSGDMKQFNECIQRAKNDFTDKVQSNLESLTHVKFRKYAKWLINENQDEEY